MKKSYIIPALFFSFMVSVYACTTPDPALRPLPGSSRIPTPTPIPTVVVSQQNGNWLSEDSNAKTTFTFTKRIENVYDFVGTVKPNNGGELFNLLGNITYQDKEAIFMLNKPGSAMVRSSYEILDNGNTFVYSITKSDSPLLIVGQKYTLKKVE